MSQAFSAALRGKLVAEALEERSGERAGGVSNA